MTVPDDPDLDKRGPVTLPSDELLSDDLLDVGPVEMPADAPSLSAELAALRDEER